MNYKKIQITNYKFKILLSFVSPLNWYYFIKRLIIRRIMSEKFLRLYGGNFSELHNEIIIQYKEQVDAEHINKFFKKHELKYIYKKLCTSNDLELENLGVDLSEKGLLGFENVNYTNFINIRNKYYEQFYKEAESDINKLINFILGALVIGIVNGFFSNYFKIFLNIN